MNNLTALDRLLVASGFVLTRMTKHKIWRCPCGHAQIASSGSRHGGRGDQNARALMSRTLRACYALKQQNKAA